MGSKIMKDTNETKPRYIEDPKDRPVNRPNIRPSRPGRLSVKF